jgi:signal transduction histidine kinase
VKDRLLEGELTARPGEPRAWRVNYSPIFNEDGSVRAISTASIEITNQKKAETALIQSEKLAAVGRLASSISHEINNPLEAITNLLYLIAMDKNLPDELKGFVHMAQSELSRVSQIATQTLRFHRQAVAPTLVTAQDLVGAVVRLYTGRLANSNINIEARYATGTRILCFENDIRQVLNNLIANAIDAMRTGGRLIVRAHDSHRHTGDGCAGVRLTIADTGHGMSARVLARAFEPFFTTKDLNGTGLGLWISEGIVQRHQGRLYVRSSDNPAHHGTIFTLFLPCKGGLKAEVEVVK